ncbi:plastocyanin/azurin family copper-binding protein [Kiloniella antarctica]|uniref:Plastocyanin/azurin family copper-binding protein n=1 Tax=Kiloniella antarctica TaxID=1550907 RepID=A0ABW5BGG7_9PROT
MQATRRQVLGKAAAAFAVAAFGPSILSKRARAQFPEQHRVEITGFNFVPDKLSVRSGDTITWINHDIAPHTATADDGSWDTGEVGKGEERSLLVTTNMSSTYFCQFHPMMKARLTVTVIDG